MFKSEDNDTLIDNYMWIDNSFEDNFLEFNHRSYNFNLIDPNQTINRIQLLFEKAQYLESLQELPENLRNRNDIFFRVARFHLFELIPKDSNLAKQFYWSSMFSVIRFKQNTEIVNANINKLIEYAFLTRTKAFEMKVEEMKKKLLSDLFKLLNYSNANMFMKIDFNRMKMEYDNELQEEFDFKFENEFIPKLIAQNVIFNISNHSMKNKQVTNQVQEKEVKNKIPPIFGLTKMVKNQEIHSNIAKSDETFFSNEGCHTGQASHKVEFKKNQKKEEKIKNKIPFLKEFNPKYTKRENIDKKILRKFKKFLKNYFRVRKNEFEIIENKEFWSVFINGNLFPPMSFHNSSLNQFVDFKSFNTQYMAWVFSFAPSNELYNIFIQEKGDEVFSSIIKKFKIENNSENEETMSQLKNYLKTLGEIFNLKGKGIELNKPNEENERERRETQEVNSSEMPALLPNREGSFSEEIDGEQIQRYREDSMFLNENNVDDKNESEINENDIKSNNTTVEYDDINEYIE